MELISIASPTFSLIIGDIWLWTQLIQSTVPIAGVSVRAVTSLATTLFIAIAPVVELYKQNVPPVTI